MPQQKPTTTTHNILTHTEKLDEWGRKQGKAQAWARRAREGEFVKDPLEVTELDTQQRAFSILSGLMIATAFGKYGRKLEWNHAIEKRDVFVDQLFLQANRVR